MTVSWSPDGSTIAMERAILEGNGEVILTSGSSGEVFRTLPVDPLLNPNYVTWARDAETLAFTDTYGRLWTIGADGSDLRRVPLGSLRGGGIAWSRPEDEIALVSRRLQLVVVDPRGGDGRVIFDPKADGVWSEPTWSPDGERIAFSAEVDDVVQIFVSDRDGSNLVQLTADASHSLDPTWSPDGAWIAFMRGGSRTDLFAVSADGAHEVRLTDTERNEYGPDWR